MRQLEGGGFVKYKAGGSMKDWRPLSVWFESDTHLYGHSGGVVDEDIAKELEAVSRGRLDTSIHVTA
jgi:hypothetical protein